MSPQDLVAEIYYPDSDGKPMAESDWHRNWMLRIIEVLQIHFHRQQVYVTGNLLMYFVEGAPQRVIAPDAMVVKGVSPNLRRMYKVWEEGKAPDVVFETTSDSTRHFDTQKKFELYAELGIREYFLYDPTSDYLRPAVLGFRLRGSRYEQIEPDLQGRLICEELELFVELNGADLQLRDQVTGQILPTLVEIANLNPRMSEELRKAEKYRRKVAEIERDQERIAREAAENSARLLAEELARLRAQIANG